jgi:lipopolysaccharide/colanic/teichoic acid biosynthesis glycosyltransferase
MKHIYRHLTINTLIAAGVFYLSLKMHSGIVREEILIFGIPGAVYYVMHFLLSLARRKYYYGKMRHFNGIFKKYFTTWLISSGLCLLILVLFQVDLSREWIMVNLFGLISGEALMVAIISIFRESAHLRELREIAENGRLDVTILYPPPPEDSIAEPEKLEFRKKLLENHELAGFASAHIDLYSDRCRVLNSGGIPEVLRIPPGKYDRIICCTRLDLTNEINNLLRAINSRLPLEGLTMVCIETSNLWKKKVLRSHPPGLNRLIYFFDTLILKVFPSLPGGRKINQWINGDFHRAISRPEILGRLYACGFEIVEEKKNSGLLFLVARKINLPVSHVASSYGLLIHLNRIGYLGNYFKFYKIRTMHPYSEYIQEYVYKNTELGKEGKFKNDYRITRTGKFLRRYWIDELPGLWNWLRGDMKLVGVRPLSKHFFNLYTPELQQKRIQVKPGLIPPFYADMPKSLDEIMESELRYLDAFAQAPFRTDVRYFFRALYNILIKGAKSR